MTTKNPVSSDYLTPFSLESQEHLSRELLSKLVSTEKIDPKTIYIRPTANFIDLMNWTQNCSISFPFQNSHGPSKIPFQLQTFELDRNYGISVFISNVP